MSRVSFSLPGASAGRRGVEFEMSEAGIGRVLVASLHQAIAEILPMRLAFYEVWLSPTGLRDGTIGLAPTYAVLSFLRLEGPTYETIMTRAGEYAAEWTFASIAPGRRAAIRRMPRWLRARVLVGLMRKLARESFQGSRCVARVRHGAGRIELGASIFCSVRAPVTQPLCGFYAAACAKFATLVELGVTVQQISCRGTGATSCVFLVPISAAVGRTEGGPRAA